MTLNQTDNNSTTFISRQHYLLHLSQKYLKVVLNVGKNVFLIWGLVGILYTVDILKFSLLFIFQNNYSNSVFKFERTTTWEVLCFENSKILILLCTES